MWLIPVVRVGREELRAMVTGRKPFKMPRTLAGCADTLYSTRQERLELQREVEILKERESQLRDKLINELPKGEASGVAGQLARVAVVKKTGYRVETDKGWDKLHMFIMKNDAWELMQRRLNDKAVRERFEEGIEVPGVELYPYVDVSIHKL